MSLEDVADKFGAKSDAVLRVVMTLAAGAVASITAVGGLFALWPFADEESPEPPPALIQGTGYTPQCSQLYNTIEHTWTEQQWSVWEKLRRDMDC